MVNQRIEAGNLQNTLLALVLKHESNRYHKRGWLWTSNENRILYNLFPPKFSKIILIIFWLGVQSHPEDHGDCGQGST